jgi:hypothetical protein
MQQATVFIDEISEESILVQVDEYISTIKTGRTGYVGDVPLNYRSPQIKYLNYTKKTGAMSNTLHDISVYESYLGKCLTNYDAGRDLRILIDSCKSEEVMLQVQHELSGILDRVLAHFTQFDYVVVRLDDNSEPNLIQASSLSAAMDKVLKLNSSGNFTISEFIGESATGRGAMLKQLQVKSERSTLSEIQDAIEAYEGKLHRPLTEAERQTIAFTIGRR